ncbi:hypothetical protein AgCh_040119 [Apium graveolens]
MNHGFHHGLQFVLLTLRYLIRRLNLSIGWHPALKLSRQYSGDNSCIYLCVSGRWFAIFRSQRASSSTGTRILPNNKSKEGNSGLSLSLPVKYYFVLVSWLALQNIQTSGFRSIGYDF